MSIPAQVIVLVIMAASFVIYRIKRALFGPADWPGESEKRADEWRREQE